MKDELKAVPVVEGKKRGRGKLLIIMVVVLVLGVSGGAGAYWWMSRGHAGDPGAAKAVEESHGDPAAISLPTFTVNLADKDASRYLRVTLSLVIPDAEAAEPFTGEHAGPGNVKLAKVRSAILELLTTKSAEELTTAEGKQALKKEIAQRASKAFGDVKVSDVLFSEFVVQY